jgi:hypothetical protein
MPVSATSVTLRVSPSRVTSASATTRLVIVPWGSRGSRPSGRAASAATATDRLSGVPDRGEYSAVPETVCRPSSEVECHVASSPFRVKRSSTGAPKVDVPFT